MAEPRPGWISPFLIYLHKFMALKPVLTAGRRRLFLFFVFYNEKEKLRNGKSKLSISPRIPCIQLMIAERTVEAGK